MRHAWIICFVRVESMRKRDVRTIGCVRRLCVCSSTEGSVSTVRRLRRNINESVPICLEFDGVAPPGAGSCARSLFNNSIRYEANNTTTYKHHNPSTKPHSRHKDEHWQHEGEHSTSEFRFQLGRTAQDALFDAAVRSEQVRYRHVLFRLNLFALAWNE